MAIFGEFDPIAPLRMLGSTLGRLVSPAAWGLGRFGGSPLPPLMLAETDDEYLVFARMPGVSADRFDVSLTAESLTLRGERSFGVAPVGATELLRERAFGSFSRTVLLPGPVEADSVDAFLRDGVLTVRLRRRPPDLPRAVKVAEIRT